MSASSSIVRYKVELYSRHIVNIIIEEDNRAIHDIIMIVELCCSTNPYFFDIVHVYNCSSEEGILLEAFVL